MSNYICNQCKTVFRWELTFQGANDIQAQSINLKNVIFYILANRDELL